MKPPCLWLAGVGAAVVGSAVWAQTGAAVVPSLPMLPALAASAPAPAASAVALPAPAAARDWTFTPRRGPVDRRATR